MNLRKVTEHLNVFDYRQKHPNVSAPVLFPRRSGGISRGELKIALSALKARVHGSARKGHPRCAHDGQMALEIQEPNGVSKF